MRARTQVAALGGVLSNGYVSVAGRHSRGDARGASGKPKLVRLTSRGSTVIFIVMEASKAVMALAALAQETRQRERQCVAGVDPRRRGDVL